VAAGSKIVADPRNGCAGVSSGTHAMSFLGFLDGWALAAWIGINILVPVLLPLLVLWLFTIPGVTASLAAGSITKSVGKGELFWAAMGMAASTCYELFALQKIVTHPHGYGFAWFVFWIHLGVILGSAIMVGLGSLNNRRPTAGNRHIPDRRLFIGSIVTLVFTAASYTASHAVLDSLQAELKAGEETAARKQKEAIIQELRECLGSNGNNGFQCLEELGRQRQSSQEVTK
jgi:hypothetical protein